MSNGKPVYDYSEPDDDEQPTCECGRCVWSAEDNSWAYDDTKERAPGEDPHALLLVVDWDRCPDCGTRLADKEPNANK